VGGTALPPSYIIGLETARRSAALLPLEAQTVPFIRAEARITDVVAVGSGWRGERDRGEAERLDPFVSHRPHASDVARPSIDMQTHTPPLPPALGVHGSGPSTGETGMIDVL